MDEAGPSYGLLTAEHELSERAAALLTEAKPFGFDIETGYEGEQREDAQLHPEENIVSGISFTNSVTWGRYVPFTHDSGTNLDPAFAAPLFWSLLASGLGVPHGGQFELRTLSKWFLRYCPELADPTDGYFPLRSDTMLEAHAQGTHHTLALKPLTKATFNHQMTEFMELFDTGTKKLTKKDKDSVRFGSLDQHDPKVYSYACEDSVWALAHHYKRYPLVKDNLIYQMEMSILPIVCRMEDFGLQYDWTFLRDGAQRGRAFQEKLATEISAELSEMLGEPVKLNLASPKQKAEILYDRLHLPVKRRSRKTNNPSTDKIALKGLSGQYPVVQSMVNWNQLNKLCGTYLEKYEKKYTYAEDGRTHPHHMQCGVPAGRFAVSDPPYQQSPKKYHYVLKSGEEFNFNFRNGIVAPAGYYGLGFDYSQIELRVMAGEAGETALIEAFANGIDVHSKTASLMLGIPLDQVSEDEHRPIGKTMNFALGYSMGVDGLADRLGISKEAAQDLFDQYFSVYAQIKGYMERTVETARRQGYVTTRFGRRVPIWEFERPERWIQKEGERLAGNAPIQGGAADYMKMAMIRADKALTKTGLYDRGVRLVMNIHDALEWYVPRDIQPEEIIHALCDRDVIDSQPAIQFAIEGWPPMEAEWHAWKKWGTAKKIELGPDGKVRIKGDHVEDVLPGDEDEEGPSLPAVDLDAMRRARGEMGTQQMDMKQSAAQPMVTQFLAAPPLQPYTGPPRTVIIKVGKPQPDAFRALLALYETTPGPNTLILRMPEGDVPFKETCGLAPSHAAVIEMTIGVCEVVYDADSVDYSAVGEGIPF